MNQEEACSICDRQPEDLLVLVCAHNLCVTCATEIYRLNQSSNQFVCEICLSETPLDDDTIALFEEMTVRESQIKESHRKKQANKNKPPKSRKTKENKDQYLHSEIDKPRKTNNKSKQPFCHVHNENALYFCFDCQAADICSQCILTPKHATHKVSTFKKASAMVEKKVEEGIRSKECLYEELLNQRSKYVMSKRHLQEETEEKKGEIQEIFNTISNTVNMELESICEQIENQFRKVDMILDGCLAEIDDKMKVLKDSIEIEKKMGHEALFGSTSSIFQSNNEIYLPRLPKQIPNIDLALRYPHNMEQQITRLLQQISIRTCSGDQEEEKEQREIYIPVQSCLEESDIGAHQSHYEAPRTVLKESAYGKSNVKKLASSRKLEMSRSLDNATNIINKLQERSRRVE